MHALIQRVTQASVTVEQQIIGSIDTGLLVLLGIQSQDTKSDAQKLAHKVLHYRVFSDENDHMNLNVQQASGKLLVVSQFTLAANTKKGLRPSFSEACAPEQAQPLVEYFVECTRQAISTETGQFGANMQVHLTNDGPVTFLLSV